MNRKNWISDHTLFYAGELLLGTMIEKAFFCRKKMKFLTSCRVLVLCLLNNKFSLGWGQRERLHWLWKLVCYSWSGIFIQKLVILNNRKAWYFWYRMQTSCFLGFCNMTGGLVSRSRCNLVLHVLLIPSRATGSLKSPFFSSWCIKNSLTIASKLKFEKTISLTAGWEIQIKCSKNCQILMRQLRLCESSVTLQLTSSRKGCVV